MADKRRRMSREDRKQDILRVAAEVFTQKGYRPTTIDTLVEAAGISKGLFYIYFDSKKQAFIELIESYFDGFAAVLEENHRSLQETFRGGDDPVEVIETWRCNVLRILKYHFENPNLAFVVYQEALGSDEDFSDRVNELSERANAMVAQEFEMMSASGAMRDMDIELATAVTMGSIVYVIMDLLLRKKRTDIEALASSLIDYHARAVAPVGVDIDRILGKVP
jgi:AcrR family transcriptional regulator